MSISRGDRIRVLSCQDPDRVDWSDQKLTGIIMDGKGSVATLVLDFPVNKQPSEEERNCAVSYLVGGNPHHILRVTVGETILMRIEESDIKSRNYMILCNVCKKFDLRSKLIQTCYAHRHFACVGHLIPVKPNTNIPDTDIVQSLKDAYLSLQPFGSDNASKKDLMTRVLLSYDTYASCVRPAIQARIIEDFSIHDLWTCIVCKDHRRPIPSTIPFVDIHNQLFPDEKITSVPQVVDKPVEDLASPVNDAKEKLIHRKRKFPRLFAYMERLGYSSEDISDLVGENHEADVATWDKDMVVGLMASHLAAKRNTLSQESKQSDSIPEPTADVNSPGRFPRMITLGQERRFRLFSPEFNRSGYFVFPTETRYDSLVFMGIKKLDLGCLPSDIFVHRVDEQGWSVVVSAEGERSAASISVSDLEEDDTLTLRKVIDGKIGPRLRMSAVEEDYRSSATLRNKFVTLGNKYKGMRKIRGDGNCYYRAIIVGLLEQIYQSGERLKFLRLHELLAKAIFSKSDEQSAMQQKLLSIIRDATEVDCQWSTWERIESDILRVDGGFDDVLISACRKLVSQYLLDHAQDEINGMPLQDIILSCYESVANMEQYCEQYVNKMGVDAEGPFIELGLLPLSLECQCTIIYLDRIQGNELKSFDSGYGINNQPSVDEDESQSSKLNKQISMTSLLPSIGHVHLLLRPGHYDLLYVGDPPSACYGETLKPRQGQRECAVESKGSFDSQEPISSLTIVKTDHSVPSLVQTSNIDEEDHDSSESSEISNPQMLQSIAPSTGPALATEENVSTHLDTSSTELKAVSKLEVNDEDSSQRITLDEVNLASQLSAPKFSSYAREIGRQSPVPQLSVFVPSNKNDLRIEMARQLCDILSIKLDDAIELCKRTSTIESAVAYYYELEEAKRNQANQTQATSPQVSPSSRLGRSDFPSNDQPKTNQSRAPSETMVSIDQPFSRAQTWDDAMQAKQKKIAHLSNLHRIDEDLARSLLTRCNWDIIDAGELYHTLLTQELPSSRNRSDSKASSKSSAQVTERKDQKQRGGSSFLNMNFLPKFSMHSSKLSRTDSDDPPPYSSSSSSAIGEEVRNIGADRSKSPQTLSNRREGVEESVDSFFVEERPKESQPQRPFQGRRSFMSRDAKEPQLSSITREGFATDELFTMTEDTDKVISETNPRLTSHSPKDIRTNQKLPSNPIDSLYDQSSMEMRNRSDSTSRSTKLFGGLKFFGKSSSLPQSSPSKVNSTPLPFDSPKSKSKIFSSLTKYAIGSPRKSGIDRCWTVDEILRFNSEDIRKMGMEDIKYAIKKIRGKYVERATTSDYRDDLRDIIQEEIESRAVS